MPTRWNRRMRARGEYENLEEWRRVEQMVQRQLGFPARTSVFVLTQLGPNRYLMTIDGERFECVLRRQRTRLDILPSSRRRTPRVNRVVSTF